MRTIKYYIYIMIIFPMTTLISSAETNPRNLKFSPIDFQPPETERVVLENGMILHLLENHELPLINIRALFRTGSIYDPTDKLSLASLTAKLMRTGGTETMSMEEINEKLEFIAGSVEISIDKEEGSASLSILKKDLTTGLRIFADVLMNPIFQPDKVELEKNKKIESIRRENDDPEHIGSREFSKKIYKGTPYGRYPTIETVSGITQTDMKNFHATYLHPNNIMLGISGDFKKEEMIRAIEKVFKEWDKKPIKFPETASPGKKDNKSIHFISKDISQSVIRMGHIGIKKTNPDYHAVLVMSYILGSGGFNSRLMKEVRSNRGLAYSVWSYFITRYLEKGIFMAGCSTKSKSTLDAITIILETISNMRKNLVTDEELSVAKNSIINSFVFAFTSSEQVVRNRMNVEFHNLPADYLETFRDKIANITKEDILKMAKKYLKPKEVTIVVVGNEKDFDRPLSELGHVNTIELE